MRRLELLCVGLSFDKLSFDELSFGELSFDELSFDELSFGELSYNELSSGDDCACSLSFLGFCLQLSRLLY